MMKKGKREKQTESNAGHVVAIENVVVMLILPCHTCVTKVQVSDKVSKVPPAINCSGVEL